MTLAAARWLDRPPVGWGALVAHDPSSTPAHRPELWEALAATRPGHHVRFVAVEEDGALVGGAGVLIERRAGLTWLHALPWLLPAAPLAAAGRHAEVDSAVGAALAAWQRDAAVAGGAWALYRAGAPPVAEAAWAPIEGETRWLENGVVSLDGGLEGAWRAMDRKKRQQVNRARAAGLVFEERPAALETAYALHVAQSRRWGGHRPAPLAVSRRLLESGVARLFVVRDGEGPLCAVCVLTGGHEVLPWWSGAHDAARPVQAYALLMWEVTAWAAAHGARRVNLGSSAGLAGVAWFKDHLGAAAVRWPVRWLGARHAGAAGRLAAFAQRVARRGRPRGDAA